MTTTAGSIPFEFCRASHSYIFERKPQPHVTGMLAAEGLGENYDCADLVAVERKKAIGRAVHKITHYVDSGLADEETAIAQVFGEDGDELEAHRVIEADLSGYLRGWRAFLMASDFRMFSGFSESPQLAEVWGMRYGMTIDRAGLLLKRPTILDLKCTAGTSKHWPVQLAGYRLGCRKPLDVPRWDAAVVWLRENGSYSFLPNGRSVPPDPVADRRDEEVFLAMLRLTWYKRENA